MEIILPEQNYSLDEINTTIYTAVKGYIENIRLLKIANVDALDYGEGDEITATFPTYTQFEFNWGWDKDVHDWARTIKAGDELTLAINMEITHYIEGIDSRYTVHVDIAATKVSKGKNTNELGYVFKAITKIFSAQRYVARIKNQGSYVSRFLFTREWKYSDKATTYSYEDMQSQQSQATIKHIESTLVYHIPKGQVKGVNVLWDSKLELPMNTPITLIPIDFKDTSPAFASFVKQMKRN